MKAKLTTTFKRVLSKILPDSEKLRYLFWLPKLNTFHKEYSKNTVFLERRNQLYDFINHKINNAPIVYCEFGVYKGASITYWTNLNTNTKSRFYGFDTFEGLPENWDNFTGGLKKGTFNTHGMPPKIDNQRVTFYKGLFQDTLQEFLMQFNSDSRLILNIDADLYTSTLFVLTMTHKILKKGSIIIFDEFSSMLHEFRAFEDYCKSYNVNFEVIAATKSHKSYYAHVAIRIL